MKPYYKKGGITLYCGDCLKILPTLPASDMLFTDPPYGVAYTGGHFHSGSVFIRRKREMLVGDKDLKIYELFLPLVKVNGPCYMWYADTKAGHVLTAVERSGFVIHSVIVWNKVNARFGAIAKNYHQAHELCLYFKRKGTSLLWDGGSVERTVWDVRGDPKNDFHPTQKPIALALRAIGNHQVKSVLDPFAGSGSTLIAAKMLGRSAVGIELNEGYCAAIVRRLENCKAAAIKKDFAPLF